MKNSYRLILFSLLIGSVSFIGYYYFTSYPLFVSKKEAYSVGVFLPASIAPLELIQASFIKELALLNSSVKVTSYVSNGDRNLIRATIEKGIEVGHNLFYVLGSSCSYLAKELVRKFIKGKIKR